MSTMKAARLHQIGGRFQLDEVPRPQPGAHDVLVRVAASGIIPNLKNVTTHFPEWYPFLPLPALPAIFGLDSAGTVEAVGSAVTAFKPGDRVYVNPGVGCGECRHCKQGETPRCEAYTFLGYFGFGSGSQAIFQRYPHAGYGQFMVAPANNLVRLPQSLSFAQATRFGYLGTAYSAIRKAALRPSQSILILGASGTLGVGATLLALAFGAAKVVVAARDMAALARLKALAPERVECVRIGARAIHEQVLEIVPGGVDAMLDTLGAKAPAELSVDAMRAVGRGGRIVQIGGVAGPIPIDPHPFMCAQLQYIGSLWFTTAEGDEMAGMVASGILDLSPLEERAYPLEQLNQALDDIQSQASGFCNFHILHA
ncbi:alcohol dehydrogenase catalytic domain-containing protein [Pseudomonas panipatensis]|uniref:Alcohol dehydrogenase n=1 Tax=Pseudomonas panipatensis TaxID=428992 RepID=A0A1G8I3J1_9PSED|nr:alcohol dehydrogenase catalytic domain-containing protein [Pseudomonas panipatensis]SDI13433.1 alcohol dehydrogenase [Pseudomonas panipatensis]SMP76209.1 alcohol dehydrogenase [Pseudomonas panipatensis]